MGERIFTREDAKSIIRTNTSKVRLPSDFTAIVTGALAGFAQMKELVIPEGITSIAPHAFFIRSFRGTSTLESLTIPSSLTDFGRWCFYDCNALKTINVPDNFPEDKLVELFFHCPEATVNFGKKLLFAAKSKTVAQLIDQTSGILSLGSASLLTIEPDGTLNLPAQYVAVQSHAFRALGSRGIKRMVIPSTMRIISPNALSYLNELEEVVFEDGTAYIDNEALAGCKRLKKIVIPESVKEIGVGAFMNLPSLERIQLPSGLTILPDELFSGDVSLVEIRMGHQIRRVGAGAFNCCRSLRSMMLPEGITRIGGSAFWECSRLQRLYIPRSCEMLSQSTLGNCPMLHTLYMPRIIHDKHEMKRIFGDFTNPMITWLDEGIEVPDWDTGESLPEELEVEVPDLPGQIPSGTAAHDAFVPHDQIDPESINKIERALTSMQEQMSVMTQQAEAVSQQGGTVIDTEAIQALNRNIKSMQASFEAAKTMENSAEALSEIQRQVETISEMQARVEQIATMQESVQQKVQAISDVQEKLDAISGMQETVAAFNEIQERVNALGDLTAVTETLNSMQDQIGAISDVQGKLDAIAEVREKLDAISDVQQKLDAIGDVQEKMDHLDNVQEKIDAINEVQGKIEAIGNVQEKLEALTEIQDQLLSAQSAPESVSLNKEPAAPAQPAADEPVQQTQPVSEVPAPQPETALPDVTAESQPVQEVTAAQPGPDISAQPTAAEPVVPTPPEVFVVQPPIESPVPTPDFVQPAVATPPNGELRSSLIGPEITQPALSSPVPQPEIPQPAAEAPAMPADIPAASPETASVSESVPEKVPAEIPAAQADAAEPAAEELPPLPVSYGEHIALVPVRGENNSVSEPVFTHEISKSLPGPVERSAALKEYKVIGYRAFQGSEGGSRFEIPEGVRRVETQAFWDCPRLEALELPISLTDVEPDAFSGCSRLTDVYLAADFDERKAAEYFLFRPEVKLHWPKKRMLSRARVVTVAELIETYDDILTAEKAKSLTVQKHILRIPEGYVTLAPNFAMQINARTDEPEHALRTIYLPKSLRRISARAFSGLESVLHIVIPDGVQIAEMNAFSGCLGPRRLVLPDSLTYIGPFAFAQPCNYEQIRLPKTLRTIPENMLSNCNTLINLNVPESVRYFGFLALSGCTNLVSLQCPRRFEEELPDILDGPVKISVTFTDTAVKPFTNPPSEGLLAAAAPELHPAAEQRVFTKEMSDSCATFNDRVKEMRAHPVIGQGALTEMANQTKFEIPLGVKRLCSYAFGVNTRLLTLIVPKALNEFEYGCFYDCQRLRDVFLPEDFDRDTAAVLFMDKPQTLVSIGNARPVRVRQLTAESTWILTSSDVAEIQTVDGVLRIPEGYQVIASFMYHGLLSQDQLRSVRVPCSAKMIGTKAFVQIQNLEEVVCGEGLRAVMPEAFCECPKLKTIVLPQSLEFLGQNPFIGCDSLETIVLPYKFADRSVELHRIYPRVKLLWSEDCAEQIQSLVPSPVVQEIAEPEPVVEKIAEPEPVVEAIAEPEPVVEEIAEPEPVVEEIAEPEPVVEAIAVPEPVAEEIAEPEPVVEKIAEPEPVVEEIAEPEPVVEKIAESEPVVEEIAEPEPVVEEIAAPEPVAEEIAEPEPVAEEIAEPEPVAEEIAEPEPVAEEIAEPETEISEETLSRDIPFESEAEEAFTEETTEELPSLESLDDLAEEETEEASAEETTEELPSLESLDDLAEEESEEASAEETTEELPSLESLDDLAEEETEEESAEETTEELPSLESLDDLAEEETEEASTEETTEALPSLESLDDLAEEETEEESAEEITEELPSLESLDDLAEEETEEASAEETTEELPSLESLDDLAEEETEEASAEETTEEDSAESLPVLEAIGDEYDDSDADVDLTEAELAEIAAMAERMTVFAESDSDLVANVADKLIESMTAEPAESDGNMQEINDLPTLESLENIAPAAPWQHSALGLEVLDHINEPVIENAPEKVVPDDMPELDVLGETAEKTDGTSIPWKSDLGAVIPENGRLTAKECKRHYDGAPFFMIPNGYREIRAGACAGMEELEAVKLPETMEKICAGAFADCTALREVVIPYSVTTIEQDAFEGCDSLEQVTLPTRFEEQAAELFGENVSFNFVEDPEPEAPAIIGDGRYTAKIRRKEYDDGAELVIPDGYLEIRAGACAGLDELKSVVLPNTLVKICSGAFSDCTSLEGLAIPASCEEIEEDAFEGCTSLALVMVPPHLEETARALFPNANILISE